jgi:hypothetical protein
MKIVTIPINEVFIKKLENKLCEIENQIWRDLGGTNE